MKQTTLLLVTMAAALLLASSVALALNTIRCRTDRDCNGTRQADRMLGTAGANDMFGKNGDDRLYGREESDDMYGGRGRDSLVAGPNNPVGFADQLTGGPGNDALDGGEGNDIFYYPTNTWGRDTITEIAISDTDPATGNKINMQPAVTTAVTINLVAGSGPEMTNLAGTSTVNWSGNVIDRIESYTNGDETITGNPAANDIRSQNGISNVSSGGGSDVVSVADRSPGDTVDCGGIVTPDNDTVFYDTGDTVSRCENLNETVP